ncbi:hypothetical protein [Sebaldella sp. S0638]|uniref:hypothetical protein n=1 Tax=Sebaldella sp. S0638 TaxID=2957809 RepID=UPI00209FE697|nr:hypothetical protein [Sebaldella sp. S0638]MCP1225437.1 hypothetical protein [Sebaldella sp. S0638]
MKKISYLLLILSMTLLFSCYKDESGNKLTLDDYKIYKSFIEDSTWYKDLLQKTGKDKIVFRKLDDSELKDTVTMEDKLTYDKRFEDKYIFSPDKNMVLDPYSYGLEISDSGEEIRDVDTALFLYDLKNNKSAALFYIGPSGSIELVSWIDDSSFITVTSDHETEQKTNFTIFVYQIKEDKISKISGFSAEAFIDKL